jgi:hypothetical protein
MLLPLVVFVNLNSRAAIQKKEVNSFRPPFFFANPCIFNHFSVLPFSTKKSIKQSFVH